MKYWKINDFMVFNYYITHLFYFYIVTTCKFKLR